MTHPQQITAFATELDKLVDRFRSEFELPVVSVLGVLQLQQHLLLTEITAEEEES